MTTGCPVHPSDEDRLRCLGWELYDDTHVDGAAEALRGHGVDVTYGTEAECAERRVHRFIGFTSPGGIRHEMFSGALQKFRTFNSPRQHAGFVTGDQGLGHVVVTVPDPDAENAFLTGVLGFQLTDAVLGPLGRIVFFHANVNKRHHSTGAGGRPGRGVRGLRHITVQARDIDDVGIALDRAMARACPSPRPWAATRPIACCPFTCAHRLDSTSSAAGAGGRSTTPSWRHLACSSCRPPPGSTTQTSRWSPPLGQEGRLTHATAYAPVRNAGRLPPVWKGPIS